MRKLRMALDSANFCIAEPIDEVESVEHREVKTRNATQSVTKRLAAEERVKAARASASLAYLRLIIGGIHSVVEPTHDAMGDVISE